MHQNIKEASIAVINSMPFAFVVGVVFAIMVLYAFEAFRERNKEFIITALKPRPLWRR